VIKNGDSLEEEESCNESLKKKKESYNEALQRFEEKMYLFY
jgi:hypothetical protein